MIQNHKSNIKHPKPKIHYTLPFMTMHRKTGGTPLKNSKKRYKTIQNDTISTAGQSHENKSLYIMKATRTRFQNPKSNINSPPACPELFGVPRRSTRRGRW